MTRDPGSELGELLGLRPGFRAIFLHAPGYYTKRLGALLDDLTTPAELSPHSLDFVQGFYLRQSRLAEELPALVTALVPRGVLWLCWPTAKSKRAHDLSEEAVREAGTAAGWREMQVAWVDAVWLGMRFAAGRT